jgi:hypothetical protein
MRHCLLLADTRRGRQNRWPLNGWLFMVICAMITLGCEEETRNSGKQPETRALDQTGVSLGYDEAARPQKPTTPPAQKAGSIIGQRTTDIRSAKKEINQGGAQSASPKIVARDPITVAGNAYVAIVGQATIGNMNHAVDLFHAENDRYPKDYEEFMSAIVRPNGIALPQLPPYQKYAYDDAQHKLIIVEYPDLKN